jgi:hypothetical protein
MLQTEGYASITAPIGAVEKHNIRVFIYTTLSCVLKG